MIFEFKIRHNTSSSSKSFSRTAYPLQCKTKGSSIFINLGLTEKVGNKILDPCCISPCVLPYAYQPAALDFPLSLASRSSFCDNRYAYAFGYFSCISTSGISSIFPFFSLYGKMICFFASEISFVFNSGTVTYSHRLCKHRGGGFSLKCSNEHSINELFPCVPRFSTGYAFTNRIPSFLILIAAFTSLLWCVLQFGQSHCLMDRFFISVFL